MTRINTTILLTLLFVLDTYSQSNQTVEMADILRQDGKIYTVVFGVVVILTGMILFLIRVDRKLFKLENNIKNEQKITLKN